MDEIFKKFYSRLKREGILKAVLCAVAISFGAVAVTAFICWMTEFSPVWVVPVVFAASAGLSFTLFYFLMFRPNFKTTAARMDALGLDERMITMHEFANNDSEISNIQRADAVQSSKRVSARMLKFCIPALLIVFAAVAFYIGSSLVAVDALSEMGYIKSGRVIVDEIANPPEKFTLKYEVVGSGTLYRPDGMQAGEEDEEAFYSAQLYTLVYENSNGVNSYRLLSREIEGTDKIEFTLESGENGEQVRAKPAEGWFLAGWRINNGNYVMGDDYRQDGNVTKSVTITAVYEQLEEPEDEVPPPGFGGGGGGGEGPSGPNGGVPGGGAGVGIDRDKAGIVIDGNTHYRDTFGEDFNHAMENGSGNESLSGDEAGIVGDYFATITP